MTDLALDRALQSVRTLSRELVERSKGQRRPIVHHDSQAMFEFICEYKKSNDGCSPTIREIMSACGHPSSSTVWVHLYKLERQGLIELPKALGVARSIRVVGGVWTLGVTTGGAIAE